MAVNCNTITGLFLCFVTILSAESRVFRIGYISGAKRLDDTDDYRRPGIVISGAISLAVDQINQHPEGLLVNNSLEFAYAETYGIEEESIRHTVDFSLSNVSAIIGPQETCLHEARLAATYKRLMLSYFCTRTVKDKGNDAQYSTFINVKPPASKISKSIASLLLHYNWTQVTLVYSVVEESFVWTAESINRTLGGHGIEVTQSRTWNKMRYYGTQKDEKNRSEEDIANDASRKPSPFNGIIQETKDKTRIYVVVGDIDTHLEFMNEMEDQQLLDEKGYFVVGVYLEIYNSDDPALYLRGQFGDQLGDSVLKKPIKAFRSFLAVAPTPQKDLDLPVTEFHQRVNEWLRKPPFSFVKSGDLLPMVIPPEAAYLHDAVFLYARALNECLAQLTDCPDPLDGTRLVQYILNKTYTSAMGYGGFIDARGEAEGNYTLLAFKEKLDPRVDLKENAGLYDIGIFELNSNASLLPTLVLNVGERVHWPRGYPPLAVPKCGFDNPHCVSDRANKISYIVGGILLLALLVGLPLLVVMHRYRKFEKALGHSLWKIEWDQLHVEELREYIKCALNPEYEPQYASMSSITKDLDADHTEIRVPNLNTEMGFYKKQLVAVKRIRRRHIDVNKPEIKQELKIMRELRCENLCAFIGACTESVVCIVMELCQRGSLNDMLYVENFALDDMVISFLVTDLVKGMCYIHGSPLKSHGSLKPSNCLVDNRFTLKITDHGLHEFKGKSDHYVDRRDESFYRRLLWTAPELLLHYPPPEGTQAGDVYSFAIVLFEIYGRSGPFGQSCLTAAETVKSLRLAVESAVYRPPIQILHNKTPECIISLIVDCWNETPESRPSFHAIKTRIAPIQREMKPNASNNVNMVDNVMMLLQRYANNLENLVNDRTLQLQEEKKKTESLLYEILPRSVAEHLIKGEKVEAEQFDCVTVFFSDIVGFTAISADSTPLEVVAFLNDLYTLFDSLLEQYDAYKVETIGDSYMVCSGLPERNGHRHAGVIASMSLHLMDSIRSFRISHKPDQPLLLRAGIHSGPVVAGVVGLKMPRYCLFGDTVNTASRFESTGEALKIHCSPKTKEILDNLGGYVLEPRGLVYMKGKGDQLTYWLTDEDSVFKEQRQQQDYSALPRADTILAKWGSQTKAKRRISVIIGSRSSPSGSRVHSRLNSESHAVPEAECNGQVPGSVLNLAKSTESIVGGHKEPNDSTSLLGAEIDGSRSGLRSDNYHRSASCDMLSVPEHSILVISPA